MQKLILVLAVAISLAALAYLPNQKPVEYTAPVAETTIETIVEIDNVTEAQRQLNEAKKLLDDEEKSILAEIEIKEKRLEEIRNVRLSFSQAPELVQ